MKYSVTDEVKEIEKPKTDFIGVEALMDAVLAQRTYRSDQSQFTFHATMDKMTKATWAAASAMERASLRISVDAATGKWNIIWPYLEKIQKRNAELSELCDDAWKESVRRAYLWNL